MDSLDIAISLVSAEILTSKEIIMIKEQQKAKELVGRFLILFPNSHIHLSKECALICVEEIEKAQDTGNNYNPQIAYWKHVKEQIKSL